MRFLKTISITDKTGELVTIKNVIDQDDLMIINKSGIAIRMEISGLRVMGRATQGVKIIKLKEYLHSAISIISRHCR